MRSKKSLCRLSVCNYGSSWIEARSEKGGVSIFLWAEEVIPRPVKIAVIGRPYTWRHFAEFLMRLREGFRPGSDLTYIDVDGESGLAADCLRLAWTYPEQGHDVLPWLLRQTDDDIGFLDAHFSVADNEQDYGTLSELADLCSNKAEKSILALLNSYSLPREKESVAGLIQVLEEEKQRKLEEAKELARAKLQPFEHQIERIANAFSPERQRIGAGIGGSRPSERSVVRYWLKRYVVDLGRMPDGEHEVFMPFLGGKLSVGRIVLSRFSQDEP